MKLNEKEASWLKAEQLQAVFDALELAGGEVRIAGGAVRNALLGDQLKDIDLATTLEPNSVIKALQSKGIKAIPTGIDHGTITAAIGGKGFEITTIREDIKTDGRHAIVRFGTDWREDALRRDLTINGLYCGRDGTIFDPLEAMEDIKARRVRFIGDARKRISEDYLRILRFFRFFAQYGSGRPDADGLKAVTALKSGLDQVSAERKWSEFRRILGASQPSRTMLWMRTTGVLTEILPESEKWGIDLFPGLEQAEKEFGWSPDAILRLEAIIRPDPTNVARLAKRLRLSNADKSRLCAWADIMVADKLCEEKLDERQFAKLLYRSDLIAVVDQLKLKAAQELLQGNSNKAQCYASAVNFAKSWDRPVFPVRGRDLKSRGMAQGKELGRVLEKLEQAWIDSEFMLSAEALIALAENEY